MKQTGTCPKCGGTEILLIKGYMGNNIIPAGWTGAKVDRYLCCGCGYSEEWISQKDIAKIKADTPVEFISIYRKQEEPL